ncbi:hypothetical protein HKK74_00735 [Actinomadura alba]|uniref:Uncharacterized protein n=2 Tax=Actinomadura alba TaxID=406431 RepID=A0ABR7LGQ6_9ACTN|nr:hypothetical protein [Actinomadura alba]
MISREAKAYGEAAGLTLWTPYMRGRCGVLGEVDADVVASAVGFFPPGVVRASWEAGASLPAEEAARRYAGVCDAFGRRKFAGLPAADADRLAGLLEAVAAEADVIGAPLFAGWRAMPPPEDPLARVSRFAHVLRELRGGLHLVAVLSCGLTPLESVLTGASILIPSGDGNARYFGWPEPYAEPDDDTRKRRADAEELTDTLVAPAFGGLSEADADEFVALLGKAAKVAFG